MGSVYVYLKDIDAERRVGKDIEKAREDMEDTSPSPASVRFLVRQLDRIIEAINVVAINVYLNRFFSLLIGCLPKHFQVEPYINLAWHAASALHKAS